VIFQLGVWAVIKQAAHNFNGDRLSLRNWRLGSSIEIDITNMFAAL
jgi:hypothetical protein